MILYLCTLILAIGLMSIARTHYKRLVKFPPGPGLPLIGYIPFISDGNPYKFLQKLSASYDCNVVGFFLGPKRFPVISVCGAQTVKEALSNDAFLNRPDPTLLVNSNAINKDPENIHSGIIFSNGPLWQEQRRFTVRHLRDLGFGKTSIEDRMMDEVDELIRELTLASSSVVDFNNFFAVYVISILWGIVGGTRIRRHDPKSKEVLGPLSQLLKTQHRSAFSLLVPAFLSNLFSNKNGDLLDSFLEDSISEHERTRVADEPARDFIDAYLNEKEKNECSNCTATHNFTVNQLLVIIRDLFGAGFETTTNSIGFAILHLIDHPEIQVKLQTELDTVCGDSNPTLTQRSSLPYTEAFLREVLRKPVLFPLILRVAIKETTFQGFNIPKDSIIAINVDSAMNDPSIWEDPEVFRPERHLNEERTALNTDTFYSMAFGAGKRSCLGESLARNTFYLFVAALVKNFEFKSIENQGMKPTLQPNEGMARSYKEFKAVVVRRYSTY